MPNPRKKGVWLHAMRRELKALGDDPADRLAFLRKWAEVKAKKLPSLHQRQAVREAFGRAYRRSQTPFGRCWACVGWATLYRHHVIQLQHGGTNEHINILSICGECHAAVHPWLEKPQEHTHHAPRLEDAPF